MIRKLTKNGTFGIALLLCISMILSICLTGCKREYVDADTIRIMLMGDKPKDFEEISKELNLRVQRDLGFKVQIDWVSSGDYKQKINLKIISGEEYDLMFDAPWCRLKNFASEGFYTDLAPYLNNDKYPGIKSNFSAPYMENNKYYGANYYFPLETEYGSGINGVAYRRDLSDKYGIGKIDSLEKYIKFCDAILENEEHMIPLVVKQHRGFFHFLKTDQVALAEANIDSITAGCVLYILLNEDKTKVKEIVPEGMGDDAFANFPEGFNYDFGMDRYKMYLEFNKYLDKDSIACLDDESIFQNGQAASIIATTGSWYGQQVKTAENVPGAVVDLFLDNPRQANMEPGSIATSYLGNNCICIPEVSEKKEMAVQFIDWIFTSQENNDLLTLGIEGKHWREVSDNTYEVLDTEYNFPGYTLTWNPNFVKFESSLPENILEYREYGLKEESYVPTALSGFVMDQVPITTELAKINAVNSSITTVMAHGILPDGYDSVVELKKEKVEECYTKGLQVVIDEVERQVNAFLAQKNQ